MNRDFTLQSYESICKTIVDLKLNTVCFNTYFRSKPAQPFVILRHDVDKFPQMALQMALLEKRYGLHSTYYFRNTKSIFKPDIIKQIYDLGHEIGYHYETMAQSNGDVNKALEIFQESLYEMRKICPVNTICMHGSSFSKWDNRDLWVENNFEDFGIIGEPYLSIDYNKLAYISDSGGSWRDKGQRVRDKLPQMLQVDSTQDLIYKMRNEEIKGLIILTHPDRWHSNLIFWGMERLMCRVRNTIKRIVLQ
ncbi:hypothetical protein [Marinifilum caeruleilacunae]|uniref:Polysaccharide deacetylase n=1 Tax=Marinifilum caeruleilacunae TaxID=2499076 RepID=A0ABX1WQY6_9BACT|nr:hypothetical protein [Marinifilum caeruleilacunae]NOU58411.1 hypothetical protein [Marinifilum caeruleilacunae]